MAHEPEHTTGFHPSFMQYVMIAIILFAITIVEFLLIWDKAGIVDHLGASKIPLLVGLSAVKFAIVIMFYMHLKFDNRLFGTVFIAGLALAFMVGLALLGLFTAMNGNQRTFAENRAIPYDEHGGTEAEAPAESTTPAIGGSTETGTQFAAGPVAIAISAVGNDLAFDTKILSVKSGDEVTVNFSNPSTANSHNFVIVQDGTKDDVARDGLAGGAGNEWIKPDDDKIIANTALIVPGGTGEVTFTAPAPGAYQFVCTFPGHNLLMFGDFVVN